MPNKPRSGGKRTDRAHGPHWVHPEIGRRIRVHRKAHNLTSGQLGDEVGIAKGMISMLESGKRNPSLEHFVALYEFFQTTPNDLLGVLDDNPRGRNLRIACEALMEALGALTVRWLASLSKSELRLVIERGREAVQYKRRDS